MKTAVIADIHGNLPGLQLVLGDIAARGIGNIICLGDLIEGGQQNNEVVELIRTSHIACIRGNHDDIHDNCLSEENDTWLAQLPETLCIDDVIFTHISPRCKQSAITASVEAWNAFEELPSRLCFIGHLHYPALYGQISDHSCDSRSYDVDAGIFTLNPEDRYIISCGAIGYPRSGGLYLRYGIYDAHAHTVEFVKLKGPLLPIGQAKSYLKGSL